MEQISNNGINKIVEKKEHKGIKILIFILLIIMALDCGIEPYVKRNLNEAGKVFVETGHLFKFLWNAKGKNKNKLVSINQSLSFEIKEDQAFETSMGRQYCLNLLSSNDATLVKQLQTKVQRLGISVDVNHAYNHYLVIAGPYSNLSTARAIKKRLSEHQIDSTLVVQKKEKTN